MKVLHLSLLIAAASAAVIDRDPHDLPYLKTPQYTTIELIEMEGYPAESYHITTSDGYILNLHRIPSGKSATSNGKVVYLQHGLLASSSDWIIMGPEKSLGYILADEGYDVWLGNYRGNIYSRNHTTLNPNSDSEFWQFSWHENGVYDIPATIDYILDKTGTDQLYYIGHSMGSTGFYVMGSEQQEYMNKIKAYIHLAPIAFMSHMTSPLLKVIAFWDKGLELLTDLIGLNEFLPGTGFLSDVTIDVCNTSVGKILCENVLFVLCGFSPDNMNMTLLPTIMEHTPAGAATKQLLHYAQSINTAKFRQYDHGAVENLIKYGSIDPPDYDLEKVTAAGYLIYSSNDWLAAQVDVQELYGKLGNGRGKIFVSEDSKFNHLDFVLSNNATNLIYPQIVSILEEN